MKITATATGKVPNTSATAASTGSDMNGMAAFNAASAIRGRMAGVAADHFDVPVEEIVFREGRVHAGNRSVSFGELAKLTWAARVQLSEAGYYATPKIHWDVKTLKGRPFFYFTYGAAVAEVAIDTLTGESRCLRADLLQDCGASLNPAIDLGQIEGAFVQGMGWLTCEELWWDDKGRLRTIGPSTYKIPGSRDVPREFNVALLENAPNAEETVYRSKAVGEPPLMLAVSVWLAIRDAIASCGAPGLSPQLRAPATPEHILDAMDDIRVQKRGGAVTVSLSTLNTCSDSDFVVTLGAIFEHSPWVAEAVANQRPFASVDALHSGDGARHRQGGTRTAAETDPRPPRSRRQGGARRRTDRRVDVRTEGRRPGSVVAGRVWALSRA